MVNNEQNSFLDTIKELGPTVSKIQLTFDGTRHFLWPKWDFLVQSEALTVLGTISNLTVLHVHDVNRDLRVEGPGSQALWEAALHSVLLNSLMLVEFGPSFRRPKSSPHYF